jgi:hypothetical protein
LLAQRRYQRRTVRIDNGERSCIQRSQVHHGIVWRPLQIDIEAAVEPCLVTNLAMILDCTNEGFHEHVNRDGPTGHLSRKRSKLTGLHSVIASFTALRVCCSTVSAFDVASPKLRPHRTIRMRQRENVDRSFPGLLVYAQAKSIGQQCPHHHLEFVP